MNAHVRKAHCHATTVPFVAICLRVKVPGRALLTINAAKSRRIKADTRNIERGMSNGRSTSHWGFQFHDKSYLLLLEGLPSSSPTISRNCSCRMTPLCISMTISCIRACQKEGRLLLAQLTITNLSKICRWGVWKDHCGLSDSPSCREQRKSETSLGSVNALAAMAAIAQLPKPRRGDHDINCLCTREVRFTQVPLWFSREAEYAPRFRKHKLALLTYFILRGSSRVWSVQQEKPG
jgi:hypothetical protein